MRLYPVVIVRLGWAGVNRLETELLTNGLQRHVVEGTVDVAGLKGGAAASRTQTGGAVGA